MVCCGDVHFKQRAGSEYLVAEKEPVSNMHTRLQNVYGVNAVENSSVSRASLVGLADSGKVQTKLSDGRPTCRLTAAVTQASLQRADELHSLQNGYSL
jgi:hypothetical protein